MTIKYDGEDDGFVGKRQPVAMTQEQDIVERAKDLAIKAGQSPAAWKCFKDEAYAQTITALRAERDEWELLANKLQDQINEYDGLLDAAEAKVKELEAEISNLDAELDHWSQLAVDDLGKNPPTSWKEIADTAIRERDEARKALEPFANAADDLDDQDEDHYVLWEHPVATNITVGDLRRARSASSNREGGEE